MLTLTVSYGQEPRLGKKLVEPLTSLIHRFLPAPAPAHCSTPAMSLIYECINTMVLGMPDHLPSIQVPAPCERSQIALRSEAPHLH